MLFSVLEKTILENVRDGKPKRRKSHPTLDYDLRSEFTSKYYTEWLHNPLISYLEDLWIHIKPPYAKVSLCYSKSNLMTVDVKKKVMLYSNKYIDDFSAKLTKYYPEEICYLFVKDRLSWFVKEYVIQKWIRSYSELLSKLETKA
jgi:hypothetical protein